MINRRQEAVRFPRIRRRSFLPAFDPVEARVLLSDIVVTNTNDSGAGSLRNAISSAQSGDHILFQIPTSDPNYHSQTNSWKIALTSPLDLATSSVWIDGLSQQLQPGATTSHPVIVITPGINSPPGNLGAGLTLGSTGDTVQGLVIDGFPGAGIDLSASASKNSVLGNYIGTDVTGLNQLGNGLSGIVLEGAKNNTISGNVVSGNGVSGSLNGSGIVVASGSQNAIQANKIGTDVSGSKALPNAADGIAVFDSNNTIGGTAPGEGNVISGNLFNGLDIGGSSNLVLDNSIGTNGAGTEAVSNGLLGIFLEAGTGNVLQGNLVSGNTGGILIGGPGKNTIQGNLIGTNSSGNQALPSITYGMVLASPFNTVGGTAAGAGNVISGNIGAGVYLLGSHELLEGNKIGTDRSGTKALPNGTGVLIASGATMNTIGGSSSAARNAISANLVAGIDIFGSNNQVLGNYIGTDAWGKQPLGNRIGVYVEPGATNDSIGGTISVTGNTISGNVVAGVDLSGSFISSDVVSGNFIGTDVSGTKSVGNRIGVLLELGATGITLGGSVAAARNIVSGNTAVGIEISGNTTTSNLVSGNYVGTDPTGTIAVANRIGVLIEQGATKNAIGGNESALGNLISGNTAAGIDITAASGNQVSNNKIGSDLNGMKPVANGTGVLIEQGASNNTVGGTDASLRNLISGNSIAGVDLNGAGTSGNVVTGNYIGLISTGDQALTALNGKLIQPTGVLIEQDASFNTVGGATPGTRNIISGNSSEGVDITGVGTSHNLVEGDFIGTSADGSSEVPNRTGVLIERGASNNTVGGTDASLRNLISGNSIAGVDLNGAGTSGNVVTGNYIGLISSGDQALPAPAVALIQPIGVLVEQGSRGNTIGIVSVGSVNVISGNSIAGVEITGSGTSQNQVAGNFIGTNAAGSGPVSNDTGVLMSNAAFNTIGGIGSAAANVISGNTTSGVEILGTSSTGNLIAGNKIGTNAQGTKAILLPSPPGAARLDQPTGISISDSVGNTIGSATSGGCNFIAGNQVGIGLSGFNSSLPGFNTVIGNEIGIGTDASPIGNVFGVAVNDVPSTQIGGPDAGNTISGNTQAGVYIIGSEATGNLVQGNIIGLGPDGQSYGLATNTSATYPFPIGVYIQDSSSNTIGGTARKAGNIISGNNVGVYIFGTGGSSTKNQILGNSIGFSPTGASKPGNTLYGVMLYNAPFNTVARTGPSANRFAANGIANYREFSGSAPTTTQAGSGKASGSKAKKPQHHSSYVTHRTPRRPAPHITRAIHGRAVPAGPVGKT